MARIVRITVYDFEFRGNVTIICKRGFFGTKLLYKYVVCPVRFEKSYFRYENRMVFAFLWNYKQPNLPDLKPGHLWNT